MLDARVVDIASAASEGTLPSEADIRFLLGFEPGSPEALLVVQTAREIGLRACNGKGYVYAQIGVDQLPCPENCAFCSFAAVNVDGTTYDLADAIVPLERIVHCARLFDECGVNLISLMATAALDFDLYLHMAREVRANVSDSLILMANVGDLSLEQAHELKEAGITAAYHALRLDEGLITDIDPQQRLQTIANVRQADIPLMTGVEPVWDGVDRDMLAAHIHGIRAFEPFCMGACALTAVEGLDVGGRRPAAREFVRYVGALTRLACGQHVPIGGIGGVAWVDAGCDPRNRKYGEEDEILRAKAASARSTLAAGGFE